MVNVAINGFGRIGRNTLRAAIKEGIFDKINYVAINDPGLKPEDAARIFKYDSVMGRFDGTVEAYEEGIIVNGKKIKFFAEKDPAQLPWKDLGVEVVIESTGFFTDATKAHAHIDAGAKKVIISAPATNEDKTIVLGVNDKEYDLLKGSEIGVNRSLIDSDKIAVPLYQTERILYKNFQDALFESGLTLPAFLEQTGLLEKLGSLNIGD